MKGINQQYGIDTTAPTTSYLGGNKSSATPSTGAATKQYAPGTVVEQNSKHYKFDGSNWNEVTQ